MASAHILLIEDNPGDVLLLKLAMAEAGIEYTLTAIEDGAQAIRYIDEHSAGGAAAKPDLLLVDLNVPKIEGLDIIRHLRTSAWADSTVVVLSSSELPQDREGAYRLNAATVLTKPSDLKGVHSMGMSIRDVLERLELSAAPLRAREHAAE